jgi:hypothetical protein
MSYRGAGLTLSLTLKVPPVSVFPWKSGLWKKMNNLPRMVFVHLESIWVHILTSFLFFFVAYQPSLLLVIDLFCSQAIIG